MAMEVYFKPTDKITVKVEVRGVEEMFQTVGPLQEVFGSCQCGRKGCESKNIRLIHRKPDKFDFYELYCEDCHSKLHLGKNDSGNLFPRRYEQDPDDPKKPKLDEKGNKVWLPNSGWIRWNNKTNKHE